VIERARDLWSPRNRNTVSTDKSSKMNANTVSINKSGNTVSDTSSDIDISNNHGKINNNDTKVENSNDDNVDENKTEIFNIHYTVEDELMEKNILLLKKHSVKGNNHNTHDNDNNDDKENTSIKNPKKKRLSVSGIKHTFDYIHKSILNKNTNKDVDTDKYVRDDTKGVSTDSKHVNTGCKDERTNNKEVSKDTKGTNNENVSTDNNCMYEGVSTYPTYAMEGEEKIGSGVGALYLLLLLRIFMLLCVISVSYTSTFV
jgi:hypothetical protein